LARTTLRRLEVFVAVVEAGGFRACSDLLDISPAAVSHQVNQLEDEIGYRLFVRRRGGVGGLTERGAKAYREARELLGHAGTFENTVATRKNNPARRLAVFADAILDELLAKRVTAFVSAHPSIDVQLRRSYFEEMLESLATRRADVAYFYSSGPVEEIASEFAWWEPICICARHDHPVFSQQALTPSTLSTFPFVAPPSGVHFRRSVDNVLRRHGVKDYNIALETANASIAREAVIGGFAISAVVTRYLDEELTRYGVRRVPIFDDALALEVRRAIRSDMVVDRSVELLTLSLENTSPASRLVAQGTRIPESGVL
jgi:DNA-binding transcriptional LysR family regulator